MKIGRTTTSVFFAAGIFCLATVPVWVAAAPPVAPTAAAAVAPVAIGSRAKAALAKIPVAEGVCVVLGLPAGDDVSFVTDLATGSGMLVYFQSPKAEEEQAVRKAVAAGGPACQRIFIDRGSWDRIHLADNLANLVLLSPAAESHVPPEEVLRVLHPEGKAIYAAREVVKPFPAGIDSWAYPYHGPDNNPLSRDKVAVMPYISQFFAAPMFSPFVEQTVAAGGRVFRAFGGAATHVNQDDVLSTLMGIDGYNGAILWRRPLSVGFMLDRNTMIATMDVLYLADDHSCKLIDARTGKLRDEIVVPDGLGDGKVWKWMAFDGDSEKGHALLCALVGGKEAQIYCESGHYGGLGGYGFPAGIGWNYKNGTNNFGFGRTILGFDLATKQVVWKMDGQDYIDARGMCMGNGRIYYYSPEKFLACLEAKTGKQLWKTSDPELLKAIGVSGRGYAVSEGGLPAERGLATEAFLKCTDKYLFFAGPQRSNFVIVSTTDGKLVYQRPFGAVHLILRDDAIYSIGGEIGFPAKTATKISYDTWQTLAKFPPKNQCTRATGNLDSIFYRSQEEGICQIRVSDDQPLHIAPMRPACTDGIVTANGMVYAGPWMCECQLSLYGHVGLAPAGKFNFHPPADPSRLTPGEGNSTVVKDLPVVAGDWLCYQGDNQRTGSTTLPTPAKVRKLWTSPAVPNGGKPTAPVTAGGLVFWGDEAGTVRAVDAETGKSKWSAATAGAVFISPAIWNGRLFVGSADGRVYAYEAVTGRLLWTYRVGPADRWMRVYGKLHSTWPVAGGVLVENGVAYAAAGIANYDGTYVCALDAITGKLKWNNDSSGMLTPAGDGVSLQSELFLHDKALSFIGGTMVPNPAYDLETGAFSNPSKTMRVIPRWARYADTPYYAYFPEYGQYREWEEHTFPDGRKLNLRGPLSFGDPKLEMYPAPKPPAPVKAVPTWKTADRFLNQLILGPQVLLVAGTQIPPRVPGKPWPKPPYDQFVAAMKLDDGTDLWNEKLPGQVVRGGVSLDHTGRIFVALEGGQVLGFGPAN